MQRKFAALIATAAVVGSVAGFFSGQQFERAHDPARASQYSRRVRETLLAAGVPASHIHAVLEGSSERGMQSLLIAYQSLCSEGSKLVKRQHLDCRRIQSIPAFPGQET